MHELPLRHPIDWHRSGRAVEHYRRCGFVYVETPWQVDDLHFSDFMKVELCAVGGGDAATMLIALAKSFFNDEGLHVAALNTGIGVDLVTSQGVEVGSSYYCETTDQWVELPTMPNLPWLVAMARQVLSGTGPRGGYVVEEVQQ